MQLREALEQLDAIHEHLTRAEVYRGFRAPGVVLVGAVGLLAAAAQPGATGPEWAGDFVRYWFAVAVVGLFLGIGAAVHAYIRHEDEFARRRSRRVFGQFAPCLLVGGLITVALTRAGPEQVAMLPGVWALVFGLGIVSARPYLPRGVGFVGLGYLVAGALLLAGAPANTPPSGWAVGGVFGAGHLATALVLWVDRVRDAHG